jgi:hypothetical protein
MRATGLAAAQIHPAWLDTPKTTAVVTDWIGRAAEVNRQRRVAVEFEE